MSVLFLIVGMLIGIALGPPLRDWANDRAFRRAHGGRSREEVRRGIAEARRTGPTYWGRDLSERPLRARPKTDR